MTAAAMKFKPLWAAADGNVGVANACAANAGVANVCAADVCAANVCAVLCVRVC
jgi:hypothetical protein